MNLIRFNFYKELVGDQLFYCQLYRIERYFQQNLMRMWSIREEMSHFTRVGHVINCSNK